MRSRKSIAHLPEGDAMGLDKENMTIDIAPAAVLKTAVSAKNAARKTRSKSIGPGGLDALIETSGNRRKSAFGLGPKSILKPTVRLSPLKEIPSRRGLNVENQTGTPTRSPRSRTPASEERNQNRLDEGATGMAIGRSPGTPSNAASKSPSRSPNFQAHDREEQELRQRERAERRKTLAARRVSFAPEATLHTWDVVEYVQDSTTSSASTNSTRRASSMTGPSSPHPTRGAASPTSNDSPSTPPGQVEDDAENESPAYQRKVHQKKRRRRSSSIPPTNFNDPEEALSSSPYSGSSGAAEDTITSQTTFSGSGSDTDDDDTVAESPAKDHTGSSMASTASGSSESARLDAALHAAATHAGTRGIDFDENGEVSMEMAGDDMTTSFKPWVQHMSASTAQQSRIEAAEDQENIDDHRNGASLESHLGPGRSFNSEEDMSMDMTRAVGGILEPSQANKGAGGARKSLGRRQSVRDRRRSSGETSWLEHGTMEIMTSIGGIKPALHNSTTIADLDDNEELSMDFTNVLGGIKAKNRSSVSPRRRSTFEPDLASMQLLSEERRASRGTIDSDEDMQMTTAVGGIIQNEPLLDNTTAQMEMTRAIGRIMPPSNGQFEQRQESAHSPLRSTVASRARAAIATSETGSPSLTNGRPQSRMPINAAAPASLTPVKKPATPSKQITPQPARPTTPGKTPPSKNVNMRSASPKRLFQEELKSAKSPTPAFSSIFHADVINGVHTPSIVLAPISAVNKRLSGNFLAENSGSPRAAARLDRRASIGDSASAFTWQGQNLRGVRFDDPRAIDAEVSRDREEEERRESRQFILEREADAENDVTANLKEMIESMTPKKNKLKGRKSLAVGAAKGLLGKRPLELDEEEEDSTPKKLRGRESSPVKKVKLPGPPPKSVTIGKASDVRPFTPTSHNSGKANNVTTPKSQGRFKDAEALPSAQKPLPTMGQGVPSEGALEVVEDADECIHLQDFLNMTSIRFMELNTTKRRHTVAPVRKSDVTGTIIDDAEVKNESQQLVEAVVAGSCTIPMLELYQHSCRELKNYISEGRGIVREIEADTYEENPPIFRNYLSAPPSVRARMDNQFKNMKTHARLLSKGMWYEWRMKLLEGLKEGLLSIVGSMEQDDSVLTKQEELLQQVLPAYVEELTEAKHKHTELQQRATELASCDQEELREARQRLAELDADLQKKRQMLNQGQEALKQKKTAVDDIHEVKLECTESIKEAKRLREESRGWSPAEINLLKARVDAVEAETNWAITSASESLLTMTYKNEIELFFDVAAFAPVASANAPNSSISLKHLADVGAEDGISSKRRKPAPLTTEKRFFLQFMQAHLHGLAQSQTHVSELVSFVGESWDRASAVSEEALLLNREHMTFVSILSDERLAIQSTVLLPRVESKVNMAFTATVKTIGNSLDVCIDPSAEVVYGERYKEDNMRAFLTSRVGNELGDVRGLWADAVRDLEARLIARGRKT